MTGQRVDLALGEAHNQQTQGSDEGRGLTFSSVGPAGIVHHARCWDCTTGQHPGGDHRWADADDIAHAVKIGRVETAEGTCGCYCVNDPPTEEEEAPEVEMESFTAEPCPVCGSTTECGYDSDGRPMIHTVEGSADD